MRQAAAVLAVGGQCGLVLLSCGCSSPGPEAGAGAAEVAYVPLGWGGPVEARGGSHVVDGEPGRGPPVACRPGARLLDGSRLGGPYHCRTRDRRFERFVTGGIFLPDGRVAAPV